MNRDPLTKDWMRPTEGLLPPDPEWEAGQAERDRKHWDHVDKAVLSDPKMAAEVARWEAEAQAKKAVRKPAPRKFRRAA